MRFFSCLTPLKLPNTVFYCCGVYQYITVCVQDLLVDIIKFCVTFFFTVNAKLNVPEETIYIKWRYFIHFSFRFRRVQENSGKLWRYLRYEVIMDYRTIIPAPLNLLIRPILLCMSIYRKLKRCWHTFCRNDINSQETNGEFICIYCFRFFQVENHWVVFKTVFRRGILPKKT